MYGFLETPSHTLASSAAFSIPTSTPHLQDMSLSRAGTLEDQKAEAAAWKGQTERKGGATWEAAAGAEPVGDPVGEAEENAAEVVEALVAASPWPPAPPSQPLRANSLLCQLPCASSLPSFAVYGSC
mmetsp:Transcript_48149/g.98085  ORF Transcript_48149/g.98085 Transcript_48149/m.98085 type:complete len:127 (-) Transcript_48149:34-414(-)